MRWGFLRASLPQISIGWGDAWRPENLLSLLSGVRCGDVDFLNFFFCRQFALKPDQSINEIRESIENNLRSNHFRAVSEQRTRNESQRPRQKGLVPFLAWPKPKIPFLVFFFCSETTWKRLLCRLDWKELYFLFAIIGPTDTLGEWTERRCAGTVNAELKLYVIIALKLFLCCNHKLVITNNVLFTWSTATE